MDIIQQWKDKKEEFADSIFAAEIPADRYDEFLEKTKEWINSYHPVEVLGIKLFKSNVKEIIMYKILPSHLMELK